MADQIVPATPIVQAAEEAVTEAVDKVFPIKITEHILGIPIHETITESDLEGLLTEVVKQVGGAKAAEVLAKVVAKLEGVA
jgi:hypothetical protein